jgi:hypothetical protein
MGVALLLGISVGSLDGSCFYKKSDRTRKLRNCCRSRGGDQWQSRDPDLAGFLFGQELPLVLRLDELRARPGLDPLLALRLDELPFCRLLI